MDELYLILRFAPFLLLGFYWRRLCPVKNPHTTKGMILYYGGLILSATCLNAVMGLLGI